MICSKSFMYNYFREIISILHLIRSLECGWPRGPMDKASDFESEDCEFESRRGQNLFFQKRWQFCMPEHARQRGSGVGVCAPMWNAPHAGPSLAGVSVLWFRSQPLGGSARLM